MSDTGDEQKLALESNDDVNKAIAMLAMRVSKLETSKPAPGISKFAFVFVSRDLICAHVAAVTSGEDKDLRPLLAATLVSLKELRTTVVMTGSEMDGKVKELESMKAENVKLKYQIKHLKRSLSAEKS